MTATNAAQLGGVAASQYVITTDPRMTDARAPTAGSSNYFQNGTSPQASSNFNIGGDGTIAGTLKTANLQTTSNTGGVQIGTDGVTDAIKITSAGNAMTMEPLFGLAARERGAAILKSLYSVMPIQLQVQVTSRSEIFRRVRIGS